MPQNRQQSLILADIIMVGSWIKLCMSDSVECHSLLWLIDFGDYDDNEAGDVIDEEEPRLQRKEKSGKLFTS